MKQHKMLTVTIALITFLTATTSVSVPPVLARASSAVATETATLKVAPSPALAGVGFASTQVGWLVGNGIILRTDDGGRHFAPQYHGTLALQNVQVLSMSDVIAWGGYGIVTTFDGGRTWRAGRVPDVKSGRTNQILSVRFVSANVGFIVSGSVGSSTSVYRTADGGTHWRQVSAPNRVLAVGFTNSQDGWLITASGTSQGGFYATTDGGLHWRKTQSETPETWNLAAATIYPTGPRSAYAQVVGEGGMSQWSSSIFRTTNGVTWHPVLGVSTAGGGPAPGIGHEKVARGPGYDAGPVAVIDPNHLRVVGGMVATGIGTMSAATSDNGGNSWRTFDPIPGGNGFVGTGTMLSFVNPNDGWLLVGGSTQTLLHTTNGGASWQAVYPRSNDWPVMGVTFVNNLVGYGLGVVGNVNQVLKTNDGGRTWGVHGQLPTSRNTTYLGPFYGQGISFVGTVDGFAVGGDGHLYKTTNSGQTWHLVATPLTGGRVFSVYLAEDGRSVVINAANGVYTSKTAGVTWNLNSAGDAASGGFAWSRAIDAITGGVLHNGMAQFGANMWASFVGAHGATAWLQAPNGEGFWKSADGGRQWTAYRFPQNVALMEGNMGFTDSLNGWLWTLDGRLMITTNGGRIWTLLPGLQAGT